MDNIKLDLERKMISKDYGEVSIDLSAIAKGYAVDKISEYLSSKGYYNFLIDIGDDIFIFLINLSLIPYIFIFIPYPLFFEIHPLSPIFLPYHSAFHFYPLSFIFRNVSIIPYFSFLSLIP